MDRRGEGPLRTVPQSLPVICASARLATETGDTDDAITFCETGLELARGWRDSSLMVPATMLELARAQAAEGDRDGARITLREARARIENAHDPGALPEWIAAIEAGLGPAGGGDGGAGADELSERELEVLRALTGSGSSPRDRRLALHLAQHDQDAREDSLFQVGRALARGGGRAGPGAGDPVSGVADFTVLVVEDHDFQRRTILQMLANLGVGSLLEAADGAAALTLLDAGKRPDIVVCDLDMPGMDGVELIRHVAERHRGVAVVFASGLEERVVAAA